MRENASNIAQAAKRLNDLREAWLNPPEWTDRVPEVIPLGMDKSPYPDCVLPKPGHEKDLAYRTLTKLYNQRPAWLDAAHKTLDAAVAQACGWSDYTPDMPDEEILKRLLVLNLARSARSFIFQWRWATIRGNCTKKSMKLSQSLELHRSAVLEAAALSHREPPRVRIGYLRTGC